jgi:Na+-transporting NADH:ubiquinone oxidoreductase subunit NqrA
VENYLDLAKSGAFNAGLNLTKRLHDGRHHLLKANLLFVPQVQLTPHHDHRGLQLHSTQIKTSEKHIVQPMNPSTLSEPDSKV